VVCSVTALDTVLQSEEWYAPCSQKAVPNPHPHASHTGGEAEEAAQAAAHLSAHRIAAFRIEGCA
jgi:hypothetical protein